jgi:hypothetical protein
MYDLVLVTLKASPSDVPQEVPGWIWSLSFWSRYQKEGQEEITTYLRNISPGIYLAEMEQRR